jgi:hypothetical protein
VARVFADGLGDRRRAERALNVALDGAPTNDQALTALIRFYQDVRDVTSVRVHLNRVAGMMRARIAADLRDGAAARVLSRVMVARADAGVAGSAQLARAAAELAVITGGAEDRERSILTSQPTLAPAGLTRPEHTELLYPRAVPTELRQIFAQLGDRLAKHVGVDLRPYGATRGDRLRAKDSPIAATAAQVADGLGVGDLDVYLSPRQPWVMIAEPTSPPSLVIGRRAGQARRQRGPLRRRRGPGAGARVLVHPAPPPARRAGRAGGGDGPPVPARLPEPGRGRRRGRDPGPEAAPADPVGA